MALFAMSLFILQVKRPKLPRAMKNNLVIPFVAGCFCLVALYSAMLIHKDTLDVFSMYVLLLGGLVGSFMFRLHLLKGLKKLVESCGCCHGFVQWTVNCIEKVRAESSVVYFTKTANISRLNKAIQYVRTNEDTNYVRIVHVHDQEASSAHRQRLELFIGLLDAIYPSVKIDVVFVQGRFGASVIEHLSRQWGVPPSLMFINCPRSERPGQRLTDLRGVRVIMGHEDEAGEFIERVASSPKEDAPMPVAVDGSTMLPSAGGSELLTSGARIETILQSFASQLRVPDEDLRSFRSSEGTSSRAADAPGITPLSSAAQDAERRARPSSSVELRREAAAAAGAGLSSE
eukprot:SRR837773.2429.p1 GENE.SRR837773.2429~~SRR837773.2429.p1  ORF type:complete len:345 (-),score=115.11 SRR837773.2429:165-1199(-)